ncbi:MAG: hypothetical protein PHR94_12260 [Methylomonas lenta]|nr:hypothetical protein [Methylomonas lenta]
MPLNFNDEIFAQWCELYVRIIIRDGQRLAQIIQSCNSPKFQGYLYATPDILPVLATEIKSDDSYLTAYACLHNLDAKFWQNPHPSLLNGHVEQCFDHARYILVRNDEAPIAKAVAENNRFKPDNLLGIDGTLNLRHCWQEIQRSTTIDLRRSRIFDAFNKRQSIKIGLSPLAGYDELRWKYDSKDVRGQGEIPFWCGGTKNETELSQRLTNVLNDALQQQVDILLFPELIMTEALEKQISAWLRENNAFEPVMRLVVAGSRHVHHSEQKNSYSNRCTAFNQVGDIEWEQEKRQPFRLTAEEAESLLNIKQVSFEPTCLSNEMSIRLTALGNVASPICLDFFHDELWAKLPIDLFLVPAMSPNLKRFKSQCKQAGGRWRASAFVCNAKPSDSDKSVFAYIPSKQQPTVTSVEAEKTFLFTIEVDIDMN